MGYDMRWHRRDSEEIKAVEAAYQQYRDRSNELRNLPDVERGKMLPEKAADYDYYDPEVWEGRSDRYAKAALAVKEAEQAWKDADVSYFRLNIWGMGAMRVCMNALGMLTDPPGNHPEFPKPEDFGVDWEDVECYEEAYVIHADGTNEQKTQDMLVKSKFDGAKAYSEAQEAVLSWYGDTPAGICVHKLCSNDGWIVTPEEIKAALESWSRGLETARSNGEEDLIWEAMNRARLSKGIWMSWIAYLTGAADHGGFEVH